MDITKLSTTYCVRVLGEKDVHSVYELALANPLYYKHCPPAVSEQIIRDDMQALPPNKTLDDKYYIGFFEKDTLVAIMDLIDSYPNKETAFIGFFMMNQAYQGKGVGSAIIKECCDYMKSLSFKHVRLGFVKGNEQSEHFWTKNGFDYTGVEAKQELYTVVVLQREL